jgi:hypothetical protein
MFRGKHNAVGGKITKEGVKDPLYTISGFWDGVTSLTKTAGNETIELFDANKYSQPDQIAEKITESYDSLLPHESAKYWHKVIEGMHKNDEEEALGEKRRLEAIQREGENYRKENSIPWEPQLFKEVNDSEENQNHRYIQWE